MYTSCESDFLLPNLAEDCFTKGADVWWEDSAGIWGPEELQIGVGEESGKRGVGMEKIKLATLQSEVSLDGLLQLESSGSWNKGY